MRVRRSDARGLDSPLACGASADLRSLRPVATANTAHVSERNGAACALGKPRQGHTVVNAKRRFRLRRRSYSSISSTLTPMPAQKPIRRSQLISPFGIGAMVDFPRDESLMPAGLDAWPCAKQGYSWNLVGGWRGKGKKAFRMKRGEGLESCSNAPVSEEVKPLRAGLRTASLRCAGWKMVGGRSWRNGERFCRLSCL